MAKVKRNQAVLWGDLQNGRFGGMLPLGIGRTGGDDGTVPGPGRDQLYVQDEYGNPVLAVASETPPGGLPSKTINFMEQYSVNYLRKAAREGRKVYIQDRFHRYGALDNPNAWTKIFHYGLGRIGDDNRSGAQIDYAGNEVRGSMPVTFETAIEYLRPSLTAQDPPDTVVDANAVAFVNDLLPDIIAYPGPDQIGFIALNAASGVTAKILFTSNAGGNWANMSADPFAADEHIVALAYRVINPLTGIRLIALSGAGDMAYADLTWGDPGTASWTTVSTTGNGTALAWGAYNELLIATASGLYISTDAGETIESTALSTNTNITNLVYINWPQLDDAKYFAFGASNTLLVKKVGSDTITTLTGPSGGGAFGAVSQALDGTIWAGNGQKLYRSSDEGVTAAGWTEVKDFGASHAASGIGLAKGDPYLVTVAVDDATPNDGSVFISIDGRAFEEITNLTNDGYNDMYQSPHDPNFVILVGDDDTAQPVVHKLAPV